jgi:hypothetical protein
LIVWFDKGRPEKTQSINISEKKDPMHFLLALKKAGAELN